MKNKQTTDKQIKKGQAIGRRSMMRLMGASVLAATGFVGCERKPRRRIVSQVTAPEYMKPGQPLYYASTWTEGAFPYGMVVKTIDGRPIKIEGNPAHPVNRGSADAAMQAGVLGLYDPERLRTPRRGGKAISWKEADAQIVDALKSAKKVALLTRSTLGPSERALIAQFIKAQPGAKHLTYELVHDRPRREAWDAIYGSSVEARPRYDKAKIILSVDCDFLATDGAALESIRQFSEGRAPTVKRPEMSRLYCVDSAMTLTGSNADHRLALRPSLAADFLALLFDFLSGEKDALKTFSKTHNLDVKILETLAKDLRAHRGDALVVAGGHLPQRAHALAALLNDTLQADGAALELTPRTADLPVSTPREIAQAFEGGVDLALCLGVNPAYGSPEISALIDGAKLSVGHGLYFDETLALCDLALPSAHNLESWNDAQPRAGVASLCQPVLAPLYGGRQEAESLLAWTRALTPKKDEEGATDWHRFVMDRWRREIYPASASPAPFNSFWEGALQSGVVTSSYRKTKLSLATAKAQQIVSKQLPLPESGSLDIVARPHHALYDGRFANLACLQELPDPITKVVWGNVARVSPQTLGKKCETGATIVLNGKSGEPVRCPVIVDPLVAPGVVAVTLAHGRSRGGRIDQGVGFNAAPLLDWSSETPLLGALDKLTIAEGAEPDRLVLSQKEPSMHERPIALEGTLREYAADPNFVLGLRHLPPPTRIHGEFDYSPPRRRWGMAIDLSRCVGCAHCVVACQAENNIPTVGAEECAKGREMHWLRIDRYIEEESGRVRHIPVMCQHCENAPCENVCPVAATTHSPEGLNEMTYNRCVGTRYCANNCPYKVRRFNFFDYAKLQYQEKRENAAEYLRNRFLKMPKASDAPQTLAYNPQVTVRAVGIMEKCSFCVQRVMAARFRSKRDGRPVESGALQTACQQTCPAGAIMFGDLNEPDGLVARQAENERAYSLLEELNTKPRTSYLAKVTNPHPDMETEGKKGHGEKKTLKDR